ncbi:sulfotransferase family protein [Roseivivax sp.]
MTPEAPLIFLHIPKTAGQSVHAALSQGLPEAAISPVRLHSQAGPGTAQLPPGYALYSGHIDWEALASLGPRARAFTVLRDPLERLASFYFYLRRKARSLPPEVLARPDHLGLRQVSTLSAEAYFFAGPPPWRAFITDHYRAPYCRYLASRKIRAGRQLDGLSDRQLVDAAYRAAQGLSGLYHTGDLDPLARDLSRWTGRPIHLPRINAGPGSAPRWPALAARLPPQAAARLAAWVAPDVALMTRLDMPVNTRFPAPLCQTLTARA